MQPPTRPIGLTAHSVDLESQLESNEYEEESFEADKFPLPLDDMSANNCDQRFEINMLIGRAETGMG